jgi:hypothetical protein
MSTTDSRLENARRIVLACSHGGQCPVVEIGSSEVEVSDDFGGRVRLTRKQFEMLQGIQ